MLMSYQFSLPKLSVPSIHDTMNRVCMQHLLTQSEFLNLLFDKHCIIDEGHLLDFIFMHVNLLCFDCDIDFMK